MTAPEHLSIDTPEQISLEFPLAGVGSRFLALAFDTLLQGVAAFVIGIIAAAVAGALASAGRSAGAWVLAFLIFALFVLYTGYFATFETLWRGQTPGKRLVGLRVIDVSGRPVSVYAADFAQPRQDHRPGARDLCRGNLSVIVTSRQQRLGDLAAGTVVVHERTEEFALPTAAPAGPRVGAHHLTQDDLHVMESFLRRRSDLDPVLRLHTARRIAQRMTEKLQIEPTNDEEQLIERLAAEYRSTSRYR